MRVAIVGSRTIRKREYIEHAIAVCGFEITTIVSGGAAGVDSLAARYAKQNNIPLIVKLPNWDRYGKAAGFYRNREIIGEAEAVIAIWDGVSRGTKHTIDLAREKAMPLFILRLDAMTEEWSNTTRKPFKIETYND